MPKREGIKMADQMGLPPLFSAPGALTWIPVISIPKLPIGPQPISLGLLSSIHSSPGHPELNTDAPE